MTSNNWKLPINVVVKIKYVEDLSNGTVTCRNCWNLLAPSISAASYTFGSIPVIAARYMSMFPPEQPYKEIAIITTMAI